MKMKFSMIAATSIAALQVHAAPVQFEDTSDKLGFTRGTETWGIAWGDLDNDNWPDLWNSGHRDFPRLYKNTGTGDFDDVAMWYDRNQNGYWMADTQRDVHGGAWGDYDNDGDNDLITGDEDELFINQATNGGFFTVNRLQALHQNAFWNNTNGDRALESDISCTTRPAGATRSAQYILLFDVDVDGNMDKICAGEGTFPYSVNNFNPSLIPTIGLVNDTALGDFNNDLRTDMVMTRGSTRPSGAAKINDQRIEGWLKNGGRGFTFSALGEVRFLIDGSRVGIFKKADEFILNSNGNNSASGRGISISYDNNTQLWTVQQTTTRQAYVRIIAQNTVSEPQVFGLTGADLPATSSHGVNTSNGFQWVSNTGLSQTKSCVSLVAADFDNDMDMDIYMACRQGVSNLANRYFDNNGDGTFTEIFSHGGEGPVGAGIEFGVADSVITADYDADGFMDLAISNGALFYPVSLGGPDTLIRNQGNNNHWIEIDLIGTISPRDAIGAKVYLTAGGITQLREQSHGYHRWSQNHSRIHFGLADNTTVDQIRVEWPSGEIDTYNNVSADQLYNATENTGITQMVLGAANPVTIEADEECGEPAYTSTLGAALLVWRECGSDNWRLRAKGGLGRLVEQQPQTVAGTLLGSGNFGPVSAVSTSGGDIVDNSVRTAINFSLTVQEGQTNTKGFNFNSNGQVQTCLDVTIGKNAFEAVYLGAAGKRIDLPFDLSGRGKCSLDSDNDGVLDVNDAFPFNPNESADSDGDGVGDNADAFPNDPTETKDSDNDGIGDNSDPTPNGGFSLVSVGNPANNFNTIDGWVSNLVINESDTYTNTNNQAVSIILSRFNFYAGDNTAPVTPFVVQVNGNDDFTVLAIGDTRNAYSIGSNSLAFTDATPVNLIIEPGVTIATGFLDANANGTNSDGGSVIRFEHNGDEVWYSGGPTGNDSASITVGQAPNIGTHLLTNLRRNYAFNIEFELLTNNDNSCFEPSYDKATEQAVFLWQDCANGQWNVRFTGGGDASGAVAVGTVRDDAAFTNVNGFSIEGNDTLDNVSNPNVINYELKVWNAAQDGFSFTPNGSSACFSVDSGTPLYLGENRVLFTSSLNLDTLGNCSLPVDPAECGEPTFDRRSEPGVFLWKDCTGNTDSSWHLRVAGGGLPWSPYIGNLVSSNAVTATGEQLETNDILDINGNGLDFRLNVANSALDGIDFTIPANSQTCFDITQLPNSAKVYVGRNKLLQNNAFNLQDLGLCL